MCRWSTERRNSSRRVGCNGGQHEYLVDPVDGIIPETFVGGIAGSHADDEGEDVFVPPLHRAAPN